jgi:hypothetical protein
VRHVRIWAPHALPPPVVSGSAAPARLGFLRCVLTMRCLAGMVWSTVGMPSTDKWKHYHADDIANLTKVDIRATLSGALSSAAALGGATFQEAVAGVSRYLTSSLPCLQLRLGLVAIELASHGSVALCWQVDPILLTQVQQLVQPQAAPE